MNNKFIFLIGFIILIVYAYFLFSNTIRINNSTSRLFDKLYITFGNNLRGFI